MRLSRVSVQAIANRDVYKQNQPIFNSSYEEWSQTRVLTWNSHVLFPQNPEEVDIGLLHFQEKIERAYTFIPALIADTIRALCNAKVAISTYLECCVSLLQIWFLEHSLHVSHS